MNGFSASVEKNCFITNPTPEKTINFYAIIILKNLPLTQATENEPRSEQITIYTRTFVCPYFGATLIMRPSEIERAIAV